MILINFGRERERALDPFSFRRVKKKNKKSECILGQNKIHPPSTNIYVVIIRSISRLHIRAINK